MFRNALAAALLGVVTAGGAGQPALAAAGDWVAQEQARLRLISATQTVAGAEAQLGLEFDLTPGWKIYWRSPGDAGLPPRIDWTGSENLGQVEIAWPVPHRFSLFGLETFGYSGQVVLPIRAALERPGEPLNLRATVDYLVCEEICIPHTAALALDLPPGEGARAPQALLIESFRSQVPGFGAERGLEITSVGLTGGLDAPVLEVSARSERPFQAPDLLVEAPPGFQFALPQVSLTDEGKTAVLRAAVSHSRPHSVLEGKPVTVTVTDGARGSEQQTVARFLTPPTAASDMAALAGILALALLGGLILNFMPCVLPVLSLKLLSVVQLGGRARAAVRARFLASAAGIVFSFLLLAGLALALKAAGLAVGWGIQFQQPLFLSALAVIMTLFAYNLLGFFEVPLPGFIGRLAARGAGEGEQHALAGSFATGALATLLATPCSAPLLGTSVGFALSRGTLEIVLIFTALGVGLALPYLLIAAVPRLVAWLPRPGAWMVWLRRVLGLLLAATALWLLTVLAAQVGVTAAAVMAGLLVGLGAVLWAGPSLAPRTRLATPLLASLLALAAFALPAGVDRPAAPRNAAAEAAAWRPLDAAAIAGLVAEGRVVFVDVTADWCITCQANKKLVLDTDTVSARLTAPGVVPMRGDWTLPNDAISTYLAGFGRYGIPFNAVYGPGAPAGVALPEILTAEAVLTALERAAGAMPATTAQSQNQSNRPLD